MQHTVTLNLKTNFPIICVSNQLPGFFMTGTLETKGYNPLTPGVHQKVMHT